MCSDIHLFVINDRNIVQDQLEKSELEEQVALLKL
jgi:hypothetical protein